MDDIGLGFLIFFMVLLSCCVACCLCSKTNRMHLGNTWICCDNENTYSSNSVHPV